MAFANFFVSEGEITKQFKGCYRNSGKGPAPGDRGTIGGSWQPSPVSNIVPFPHETIEGLYIYAAQTSGWIKMVGMQYGGPQGPVRVDGRAYQPVIPLNAENVTTAWNGAQDKGIENGEYTLTIQNETPKTTISQCMNNASKDNVSVFSVSNLASNNMAQCVTGSQVSDNQTYLLDDVNESECLKIPDVNTVYNIVDNGPNPNIMGKTYLGKTEKGSNSISLHEYPDSMLELGTDYKKTADFVSEGNTLSGLSNVENSSPELCKQLCVNAGQNCQGFVYSNQNQSCSLQSTIYPNAPGKKSTTGQDTYLRLPTVLNNASSGCPDKVKPVSSKFLTENGLFSQTPASLEYKCSDIARKKEEELSEINKLDDSYKLLKNDVSNLQTENNQILKGFQEIRKRFVNQVGDYDKVTKHMKKIVENPTSSQMLTDMRTLSKSFSMHNTGLFLGLILTLIILLRVMRK